MKTNAPFIEEIHFTNGSRQTIKEVIHIEQGNWFHVFTLDGRYYIINPDHIDFIRVYGDLTDDIKQKIEEFKNSDKQNYSYGLERVA